MPEMPTSEFHRSISLIVTDANDGDRIFQQFNGALSPFCTRVNHHDFLEELRFPRESRDIAILDIRLRQHTVEAGVAHLRSMRWGRIVVAGTADTGIARRSILSGASAYVVIAQVQSIDTAGAKDVNGKHFSKREIEVIQLVADGLGNRGIGEKLGLAENTVKSHLRRIAQRIGMSNRCAIVAFAMRHGLIV